MKKAQQLFSQCIEDERYRGIIKAFNDYTTAYDRLSINLTLKAVPNSSDCKSY